jgi:hypothetical protein
LTHKDLVRKARAWLENTMRCTVVMSELATRNTETPDSIGFYAGGGSILVECKASRADFLADKNKIFRREEERGMGDHRYFMVSAKLISPEEVPDPWGLIEIYPSERARIVKEAKLATTNKSAEITMLVSVLRRLEISTAVFVRHEEIKIKEATHEQTTQRMSQMHL